MSVRLPVRARTVTHRGGSGLGYVRYRELLGATVLTGAGTGRQSGLGILAGAMCLLVFAYLSLRREIRTSNARGPVTKDALDVSRKIMKDAFDLRRRITEDAFELRRRITGDAFDAPGSQSGQGVPQSSRPAESFDDFAASMVRTGVWVPISVYTAADDGTQLKHAVTAALWEFGLASVVEKPPVQGSWFQRFWARSQKVAGSQSVRWRLAQLEEAFRLEHLAKRRAEIDKEKAESVAALLAAMREQENAVVRIGSIIAIKTHGDLVVWTISEMEATALEKNGDLLGNPVAALKFLRESRDAQELRRSPEPLDSANRKSLGTDARSE